MTYQIADEPVETSLRSYVVRPSMPLLAIMLGGAWLAWPWFAFNAIAMGSPTRRKEIALCAAAFAGTAALGAIVIALFNAGLLPDGAPVRLAVLGVVTFKVAITYHISAVQSRTFHVYEYYGGRVRDPRRLLGAAYLLRGLVIGLVDHPLWEIIVAGAIPGWHAAPWGW
ncbi:MAG TPA: hypothetical protein VHW23_07630 [Kofleriaceae bacterium]|jgi:hypothetical protein|nr:hypothetical protein [Kofleriaceae bacterium]